MTTTETLDRAGGEPLYAQIRQALQRRIESHAYPPGMLLPTEEELVARYGVSRSVIRQALGDLAERGLITRQRGRGSVVAPLAEHRRRAAQAGGLRQQLEASGRRLRTDVLALDAEAAPPSAARALGTTDVWRLERLRFSDGDPVVYMHTWLPRAIFPTLTAEGLDGGSLHEWMREQGVHPSGGPRQMAAVPADELVAHRLAVSPGTPVLLLEGVTLDDLGRGVEWFSAWHAPSTVFDVDAQVTTSAADAQATTGAAIGDAAEAAAAASDADERQARARRLAHELAALLDSQH